MTLHTVYIPLPFHDPCSLIEDRPLIFHYPTRHKLAPIQDARFAPIFPLTPSELLSLLGLKTGRFSVKRWSSNDEPIQLQVLFFVGDFSMLITPSAITN